MDVAIIKYNAGNIQSVIFALERIHVKARVTDEQNEILSADKVIFPGVGEASSAMSYLKERGLDETITKLKQPVLGICLGMQLLCEHSTENDTSCLGIFNNVYVKQFEPSNKQTKVPQIGWNRITALHSELFDAVDEGSFCYFVHGYYANISEYTVANTHYAGPYSSALQKNNFYGVQFHPEKSAQAGERILKNFLKI